MRAHSRGCLPIPTEDLNPAHPHVRPAGAIAGTARVPNRSGEREYNYTANRVLFATMQIFCETAIVQNQFFVLCRNRLLRGHLQ